MTTLTCPLCSQSRFETLEALKVRLVTAATQNITCPICNDSLLGLDKFTIHLFGHTLPPEPPDPPPTPQHQKNELIDSLCTVNMEDLNCLTSWESCCKGIRSEATQTDAGHGNVQEALQGRFPQDISQHETTRENFLMEPEPSSNRIATREGYIGEYTSALPQLSGTLEESPKIVIKEITHVDFNQPSYMSKPDKIYNSDTKEPGQGVYPQPKGHVPPNQRDLYSIKQEPTLNTISFPLHVQSHVIGQQDGKIPDPVHEMFIRFQNSASETQPQLTLQLQAGFLGGKPIQEKTTPVPNEEVSEADSLFFQQSPSLQRNESLANIFSHDQDGIFNRKSSLEHILEAYGQSDVLKQRRDVVSYGDSNSPEVKSQESPGNPPSEDSTDNKELSEYMSDLLKQKLSTPSFLFPLKEEKVKCEVCSAEVENTTLLAVHREVVHAAQTSPDPFPCKLCGKGFKMRGSLLVHTRVAHGGCGADAATDSQWQQIRNFHCTVCSKSFKKESHLGQHMKTHDGKQWQCETCSKYFTTKYFLKKHQRLHTGEMPYCCETCKKTFTFQQSYHKHLLYHSADKPHECQECGRSFKELSTLHNHQRIHSGEKPFACETCGKCFRQRVSYIVHQRIHTGVLPYQCTACKKKFRYKVSQRSHKCTAQPPGIVVRQPGDLIQRIMEHRQNILQCMDQS